MQPLKIGILGFGRFAESAILPAMQQTKLVKLVAIQKRNISIARAKAGQYGIPYAYDSEEELVRNPDVEAVFIASSNNQHLPQTRIAARHGKHVLCEKPMALSVPEAREMIRVCRENEVKLMIAHMLRYSKSVREARQIYSSGALGDVRLAHSDFCIDAKESPRAWIADPAVAGGGPVMDVGVHALDTIRCILGRKIEEVQAFLEPPLTQDQIEWDAQIGLRFSGGLFATIQTSFRLFYEAMIVLHGTQGTLQLRNYSQNKGTAILSWIYPDQTEKRWLVENGNFYKAELEAFAQAVLRNEEPEIPGEEGLENQIVLDRAYGKI
ncbi:MAG TPA: Gfo/Idh/MocA family oxidoreductase [Bacteroidetes bacterium]|nr:Gfo/Idh/MocA family oxidoreductase [Bacteroidota bacterium]